ncbi:MAG: GatB/YqeY domain-containing protein, partial [Actinomycetota bacterium]
MALKEKLQSDLTQSMRDRDELRSVTIRMVLTAIKNEEVSGKEARELSDAEVITVLSREAKKRREAAEAYEQAGAKERAATEKAEGEIIATYLPVQL